MDLMTDEQKEQFREEGYLVASGLIPEDVARKGEDAMWAVLEMDREDPETWSRVPGHAINKLNRGLVQHRGLGEPDILACYTDDLLTALSELTGIDRSEIKAPKGILTQNTFPTEGEWSHGKPHLDGGTNRDKFNVTFPIPIGVHSILYLSDGEKQGGGTFAWPGSHKKMRGIAEGDPEAHPYLWEVNSDMHTVDIGEGVEVIPKCGDILLYQNFCVHAGSKNVNDYPRLACRSTWRWDA